MSLQRESPYLLPPPSSFLQDGMEFEFGHLSEVIWRKLSVENGRVTGEKEPGFLAIMAGLPTSRIFA